MKKCNKCLEYKEFEDFYKSPTNRTKDGLQTLCKKCVSNLKKKRLRTKKGLIIQIYQMEVAASKRRGHLPPEYSKEELIEWTLKHKNFESLYSIWVKSEYEKYRVIPTKGITKLNKAHNNFVVFSIISPLPNSILLNCSL